MAIASRADLIQYALRALGEPVVEVNVDDVQLEDRVDEALDFWHQYHFDGAEKFYLKQKITASTIDLTSAGAPFTPGTNIVGSTSGANAKVTLEYGRTVGTNTIMVQNVTTVGNETLANNPFNATTVAGFLPGETITGDNGATAVIDTSGCTLGTYDLRYLPMPDYIYGVTRVMPFSQASSSKNLFDMQYQLRLNDLYDLTSTSLIYYKTVMSHISMLNLELNGYPLYRFNRMMGRLEMDVSWDTAFALGDFVVIECYRALDPTAFSKIWNEQWFKRYVIALFKRQWAVNGKKFSNMVLPGGVVMDFNALYKEATDEIKELHDEMLNKSSPLEFFLG